MFVNYVGLLRFLGHVFCDASLLFLVFRFCEAGGEGGGGGVFSGPGRILRVFLEAQEK